MSRHFPRARRPAIGTCTEVLGVTRPTPDPRFSDCPGTLRLPPALPGSHTRELMRPTVALYVGDMGAPGRNFCRDLVCSYGHESAAVCLAGPEGYVRDRVEVFREAGVTMLDVTPVGPDPARLIERVRSWL